MKRLVICLLAVLLLAGCSAQQEQLPEKTEPTVEATEPVSLYMANSSVEQQTGGAVKVYVPEDANYIGMATMAGKVVLVSDLTELTLMDAQTGRLEGKIKVGEPISFQETDFTVSDKGISFYRDDGRELVFLNTSLQQEAIVEIPEDISGHPCVSHTNQEIYYTQGKEVRALHMQTGISRLVKSQVCQSIELVASHLDGTMLACRVIDEQGVQSMLYIDSATGQTREEANQLTDIQSGTREYLVSRREGILDQQIYGTLDTEPQSFNLEGPLTAMFQLGGGYRCYQDEGALALDFYDFEKGTHSASIRMVGVSEPISVAADDQHLWFLAQENGMEMLYCWDVNASPTGNDQSYIAPFYTRDKQDTQGLEQCAQRAAELQETYGVVFHVGQDALAVNGGQELTDEYQVPAITQMLDRIEALMAQFPENFLRDTMVNGQIHISLVREMSTGKEMVQFYENGNAYVLLAASENIEENFLHGIGYMIDSHVLGNSRKYDEWKNLNPDEFDYDYSYYVYHTHDDSPYLQEEDRAFADAYGMTFPHEDRCRLFVHAMMPGNEELFAGKTMQKKLERMCEGIRDAYGLKKSSEEFLWEQYLEDSLAR